MWFEHQICQLYGCDLWFDYASIASIGSKIIGLSIKFVIQLYRCDLWYLNRLNAKAYGLEVLSIDQEFTKAGLKIAR